MNLIVDIGNTATKLAVYDGGKKFLFPRINELSCEELEKDLSELKIERAISFICEKVTSFSYLSYSLANIPFVHVLSHKSRLPFKIEYETPETLGTDRISSM